MTDEEVLAKVNEEWTKALDAHYEEGKVIVEWDVSYDFWMALRRHKEHDTTIGLQIDLTKVTPDKLRGWPVNINRRKGFFCTVTLR